MKIGATLALLFIAAFPAFAQSKDTPQSACTSGEPWFLPAAPASGETSILVVVGASQPMHIRLCNCAAKEDGQTFIRVNPNTSTPDPRKKELAGKGGVVAKSSITSASQLYVGSCLEAIGNSITIRNTLPKDQRGTYLVR